MRGGWVFTSSELEILEVGYCGPGSVVLVWFGIGVGKGGADIIVVVVSAAFGNGFVVPELGAVIW